MEQGIIGALPIPPDYVGKDFVISSLVANIEAITRADRYVPSLKQLQVSYIRILFVMCFFLAIVLNDI